MNRALCIAAATVALAFAGCGNTLDHGTITGAHYRPPETTTVCIPTGVSPYMTIICEPSTSEPDWWLDLKNCNPDPKTEKLKCVTGTYDVSEATYRSAKIGDHFDARGKN